MATREFDKLSRRILELIFERAAGKPPLNLMFASTI
jgi:hypothetical protein